MNDKFWEIRTYRPADFKNYVQLCLDTSKRDRSGETVSGQLISEALGHPSFQPEKDLLLAESDQKLVGCVSVFLEPGIGRALLEGLVHPLYRRRGIATDLFEHAVRYARGAGVQVAQICISESNLAAKNMLLGLGLRFFRHFIGYRLNLATTQLPEIKSEKFIFRQLQAGEAHVLTDIQNRSFADTWGFNANTSEEIGYRINSSSCTPENVIMVYLGDRAVAYCWTRIFQEGDSAQGKAKGEIHMLGVDPDFRQRHVGRDVLTAGLSYLKRKGVGTVELMADSEMPAALALYDSAGFEEFMRVEWYQKEL